MIKLKKKKIAKIIWITAIFLELIIILIMVIDYKINYQYLQKNKLYFYDCDGTLCVTEVEDNSHLLYSIYECGEKSCPIYKSELNDSYVILNNKDNNILYNYRNNKIISQEYQDYKFLNSQYIIVSKNGYQGIINLKNEITTQIIYEQLGYMKEDYLTGYGLNYIIAKKNNKYGIISFKDGKIIEPITHPEEEINTLLELIKKEPELIK